MKIPDYLSKIIGENPTINVLEIGPNYPFLLIELLHKHKVFSCLAIDSTRLASETMISKLVDEANKKTELEKSDISDLINDEDKKVTFYNSYKWYVTMILNCKPKSFTELNSSLKMEYGFTIHSVKSLKEKLNNQRFKLIIASKSLSHIKPVNNETKIDIVFYLISILDDNGLIYLRLNSEEISKDDYSFCEREYIQIKEKIKVIYDKPFFDEDKRMHYEVIGTTISNT